MIRSPTRVDFAGGTLDCWPLYLMLGDCVTINISISIYTQAVLEKREAKEIELNLEDLRYSKKFKDLKSMLAAEDKELDLVKPILEYLNPQFGFKLALSSQSPVGGGLGGSSSLLISILKAFSKDVKLPERNSDIVTLASHIESKILKMPAGTQDYYPALSPGFSAIHYTTEGHRQELLHVDLKDMKNRFFLVYTGRPHHSGLNNWSVTKASLEKDPIVNKALSDLKDIAWEVYDVCKNQRWNELKRLFGKETEARLRLSPSFSSPEIEKLKDLVESLGQAIKICGAGGGGCVMVWTEPSRRQEVIDRCQKDGFQILEVEPVAN